MKHILIHGLGQNDQSWNQTSEYLKANNLEIICPNLFGITGDNRKDYRHVYQAFADFCNGQDEKLNLCGLSLGGILALDYVREYPEKVNSIIIIGVPFQIPALLFKIQNIIFRLMPESGFEDTGCSKSDFITLVHSMADLDIKKDLDQIRCKCLILCGAKDHVNMRSAKLFHRNIRESDFRIISHSSHEVNTGNPKELADVISDFWKEI